MDDCLYNNWVAAHPRCYSAPGSIPGTNSNPSALTSSNEEIFGVDSQRLQIRVKDPLGTTIFSIL